MGPLFFFSQFFSNSSPGRKRRGLSVKRGPERETGGQQACRASKNKRGRKKVGFFEGSEVKWARAKVQSLTLYCKGWEREKGEEGVVQNGRCAGQKSPNENGPLRQKLMTGGSEKQDFHSTLWIIQGCRAPICIADAFAFHSSSLSLSFPLSDSSRRMALPQG